MIFQPILIVLVSKCTEMHDKSSRAVEMTIKWLVCSVFSINIAQAEFFCF